jgi:dihydrofolate reductase
VKTQYYTAATLDGFIADENNSLDWLFQFGGDPEGAGDTGYSDFIREVGALAMGSTTYQGPAASRRTRRGCPWGRCGLAGGRRRPPLLRERDGR